MVVRVNQSGCIEMGQHDQNTVQRFRRSGVNPDHRSPGDRGLDRIKISRLRHGLLIRVQGRSSDFGDPVQPSKADTDRLTIEGRCSRFLLLAGEVATYISDLASGEIGEQ